MFLFQSQISNGTSSVIVSRKRPSEGNYEKEKDLCIKYFDQWSESDQVEFVEHLISRMYHYQHGHINSYLKPMLQRDFITALPGKWQAWSKGLLWGVQALGNILQVAIGPYRYSAASWCREGQQGGWIPSVINWIGHWMPVLFHVKIVGLVCPKEFLLELELSCPRSCVSASFGLNSFFIQTPKVQKILPEVF